MRKLLLTAATATSLVAAIPAFAGTESTDPRGGYDYGPMGQCFDPRVCGHGRNVFASAHGCPMVRERVVTESGHVIFKRHRVCT